MGISTVLLICSLTLLLGLAVGWLLGRTSTDTPPHKLLQENSQLKADLAAATQAEKLLTARVKSLETRAETDADVLMALAPIKTQLATMEKSVRTMETQRAQQYGGLTEALTENNRTQHQLRDLTATLSTALRSTSARGTWGEAQLRRVVEAAGMAPHVTYTEQTTATLTDGHGNERTIRPDMTINLPGGKTIILDAKAPLTAYLDAQDAPDDTTRNHHLTRHTKAVRTHIDTLASKQYWAAYPATPELILCFIPAESALSAALTHDPTLLDYAATKNIALVSPISLLSSLKAIAFTWKQEALTNNARDLYTLSQQLYERLSTTGTHLTTMGKSLTRAVESYNSLVGSLETRVFVTARKIATLNADTTHHTNLTPTTTDATPKPLTTSEFLTNTPQTTPTTTSPLFDYENPTAPEPYDSWTQENPDDDTDWTR